MQYREVVKKCDDYKQDYVAGLDRVILRRQQEAAEQRIDFSRDIFTRGESYRQAFRRMLGWPLVDHTPAGLPPVREERLSEEEGYTLYRMGFEILEGLWLTGLFCRRDGEEKKPLVIVQHGGLGTPELMAGAYDGNTYNYNDMFRRVVERDMHAFAPQLLLWEKGNSIPFDRVAIDARLKRVGSSIAAVEIYGITRILDYFASQPFVGDFGMLGLSYGGFYTLYTAAAETRIQAAISCSFFGERDGSAWPDFTWPSSAYTFDDVQVACLVYPRRLWLQMGDKDEIFDIRRTVRAFEALEVACSRVGTDWVTMQLFDGTHEFCREEDPLDELKAVLG